jgi:hypothetical protein
MDAPVRFERPLYVLGSVQVAARRDPFHNRRSISGRCYRLEVVSLAVHVPVPFVRYGFELWQLRTGCSDRQHHREIGV